MKKKILPPGYLTLSTERPWTKDGWVKGRWKSLFKGIKGYAPKKNKIDNSGDGLLELKGKWRARAKQTMHRMA